MADLKKGTLLKYIALLIILTGMCLPPVGWAEKTIIKRIRTGSEQAYVRVVIETDNQLAPRPTISANGKTLSVSLVNVEQDISKLKSEAYRNDVINIDLSHTSTETHIKITLAFIPTRIRTFFLVDPHRFVIDAYRPSSKTIDKQDADALKPISIIEENGIQSNEINDQKSSLPQKRPTGSQAITTEAGSATGNMKGSNQKGFQQRLLIFLIIVTSIILVVIIFLMCMDRAKNKP